MSLGEGFGLEVSSRSRRREPAVHVNLGFLDTKYVASRRGNRLTLNTEFSQAPKRTGTSGSSTLRISRAAARSDARGLQLFVAVLALADPNFRTEYYAYRRSSTRAATTAS